MARDQKPRVRKAAPTIRERAEVAQNKAVNPAPGRTRSVISASTVPFKRVRLPQNRAGNGIRKAGRIIRKVLGRLFPKYFVNSWKEVRQVTWPNRKETWRLTMAVFIFAIIFGALVAGVDKVLDDVFKKLVLK